METKHTPTPWEQVGHKIWKDAVCIGYTNAGASGFDDKANAAFIVRACNAHEELVEALESAIDILENHALNLNIDWQKHCADEKSTEQSRKGRHNLVTEAAYKLARAKIALAKAKRA